MEDLITMLEKQGYYNVKVVNGKICALFRFIFTIGLVVDCNEHGYKYRYCYENAMDAKKALEEWDGEGHPLGDWIKRKGEGGDLINPLKEL